jgi:hypothetical protein
MSLGVKLPACVRFAVCVARIVSHLQACRVGMCTRLPGTSTEAGLSTKWVIYYYCGPTPVNLGKLGG